MEDIDAAFKQAIKREVPLSQKGDEDGGTPERSDSPSPDMGSRGVTLSGLLNALDGIGAQEGRILFATTNNHAALDPALIRPGRMDAHIEFKFASKSQAEELFKCFYNPPTIADGVSQLLCLDEGTDDRRDHA